MIFVEGKTYATVWSVKPAENGKYIDLQITTGEKDADGNWTKSSWFPRVIGHALNSLKNVKEKDRILIKKAKLTNERREQEDGSYRSYFHFIILEAEIAGATTGESSAPSRSHLTPSDVLQEEEKDDDCPW